MSCLRARKGQMGAEAPCTMPGTICMDEPASIYADIESTSGTTIDQPYSIKDHLPNNGKPGISPRSSVHELLECPVCTNSMYPPIHQCPNGHTLCSNCKSRVHNKCPTCRQDLGNIRCLALEKVAVSLDLPCKYHNLGCSDIFPYYSKLEHEAQCAFRPYNCPYAGSECSIMGDIPTLVAHLRDDHKVDMHNGCTFNHRYVKLNPREVENATWMLTVSSLEVLDPTFTVFGGQTNLTKEIPTLSKHPNFSSKLVVLFFNEF